MELPSPPHHPGGGINISAARLRAITSCGRTLTPFPMPLYLSHPHMCIRIHSRSFKGFYISRSREPFNSVYTSYLTHRVLPDFSHLCGRARSLRIVLFLSLSLSRVFCWFIASPPPDTYEGIASRKTRYFDFSFFPALRSGFKLGKCLLLPPSRLPRICISM